MCAAPAVIEAELISQPGRKNLITADSSSLRPVICVRNIVVIQLARSPLCDRRGSVAIPAEDRHLVGYEVVYAAAVRIE